MARIKQKKAAVQYPEIVIAAEDREAFRKVLEIADKGFPASAVKLFAEKMLKQLK